MAAVVGIMGVKGSGKDTLALELKAKFESEGKTVDIICFSDSVREMTYKELKVYPKTPEAYDKFKVKTHKRGTTIMTGRQWLEYFAEGERTNNPIKWSNLWFNKAKESKADIVIASDVRFASEIQAIACLPESTVSFYFCDYKSGRYDKSRTESNTLAIELISQGVPDRTDITSKFI